MNLLGKGRSVLSPVITTIALKTTMEIVNQKASPPSSTLLWRVGTWVRTVRPGLLGKGVGAGPATGNGDSAALGCGGGKGGGGQNGRAQNLRMGLVFRWHIATGMGCDALVRWRVWGGGGESGDSAA